MNGNDVRLILEKSFPPMPESVKKSISEALACHDAKKHAAYGRVFLRIAIIVLIMMALGVAAVTAMQKMGVLNFNLSYMKETYYKTLPDASELVQKDLAAIEGKDVSVYVREAVYDGRLLSIYYAVINHNAAVPYGKQAAENGDFAYDAESFGNMGACDWVLINGEKVGLVSSATSAGEENGEILYYLETNLEPYSGAKQLRPEGEMTVGLPIQWDKDGAHVPEGLTFTMHVGDTATRYALKLPEPVDLDGCRIQFTDLNFSPVNISVSYLITIPSALAAGKSEEELSEMINNIAYSKLENDKGEFISSGGKDGSYMYGPYTMENGDTAIEVYDRCIPSERYTPVIYLVLRGGDRLPIPMIAANE